MIVAAGAGCLLIEETRHLPLGLIRGQTLRYANPNADAAGGEANAEVGGAKVEGVTEAEVGGAAEAEVEVETAVEVEARRAGGVRAPPPSRLGVGVSGAVYLLPLPGRLVCGGTHEAILTSVAPALTLALALAPTLTLTLNLTLTLTLTRYARGYRGRDAS